MLLVGVSTRAVKADVGGAIGADFNIPPSTLALGGTGGKALIPNPPFTPGVGGEGVLGSGMLIARAGVGSGLAVFGVVGREGTGDGRGLFGGTGE